MIYQTDIQITFPEGASFAKSPALLVYTAILKGIKRISCFESFRKCDGCPSRNACKYYWITGDNFQTYPGLLVQSPVFSKNIFQPEEKLCIKLFWIGDANNYSVLCTPILEGLNQQLAQQTIYIESIQTYPLLQNVITAANLRVVTPVENLGNLSVEWLKQSETYSIRYSELIRTPNQEFTPTLSMYSDMGSVYLGTKTLRLKGFTGLLSFDFPASFDSRWLQMGLSINSCIGGGHLEIIDSI